MLKNNLILSKLFSTGPAMVVAIDHGMFDGPIRGIDDVSEIAKKILPEIDAVLLSPGMFSDIGTQLCGHRYAPLAITRINWSTVYCFSWDYHSGDTVMAFTPRQALKIGSQMVLISLSLQTGSQERDAHNIEVFTKLCNQAHDLGIPVIGEYFPVDDEKMPEDEMFEEIKLGCRILYELGADAIKTFYTKDFEQVVSSCPLPILSLGGKRLLTDLKVLQYAQQQIESGSAGIVFGRNIFQSEKPLALQKALLEVVKNKISPEKVVVKYNLIPEKT